MEAGPGDFVSCINLMDEHGLLRKRGGMRILESYGNWVTSGFYTGWGTTTEPTSVSTGAVSPSSSHRYLYVGGGSVFYQFHVHGTCVYDAWSTVLAEQKDLHKSIVIQYWNGSAWTAVNTAVLLNGTTGRGGVADLFRPQHSSGIHILAPYMAFKDGTSGTTTGFQVRGRIKPPSDWATKTINGKTLYWLRIAILNAAQTSATSDASSSRFTTTEHTMLCVLPFQDRRGTPHLFTVWRYSDAVLKYVLDGTTLTASDGLEPDGSAAMFNDATRVFAYYDSSTDRIIGYVEGHTWFYATALNNGEIYSLAADDTGTDTPYRSVIGGLRSVIPPGTVACTHDDRIWTADGQKAVYSSPGPFKDIWPNDNELFIADDRGNVTAMVSVGGVLGIFKRDAIWVAQGDGSADGYAAYRLPGNVGCVAPKSLAVSGDVAYFLAEDGVYRFDGQSVQKLSKRIDGYFSGGWSSSPERAIGVWHPQLNQYRLFYPGPQAPPWVCTHALYCCAAEQGGFTFWPQGPKDARYDEGFNATVVVRDDSRAAPRMLLGDRYGNLWVMDTGPWEGAHQVRFDAVTHRMNLGTAQRYLLRWVTPVTPTEAYQPWTLAVWPDGHSGDKQTLAPNQSGDSSALGFHGQASIEEFDGAQTYAVNQERASGPPQSVEVMGRFIQMQMADSTTYGSANPWALDAIEIEARPFARAG